MKKDRKDKPYLKEQTNEFNEKIEIGPRKRTFYVKNCDKTKILEWIKKGFSKPMTTPNNTLIWVTIKKQVKLLRIKSIAWVVYLNVYSVIGLRKKVELPEKKPTKIFLYTKNSPKN